KIKTERERKSETKVSGIFTGAYAINPFTKKEIPIWIADYVLNDYGTGAIMAVPGHDSRDWEFAKKFALPIVEVIKGGNVPEAAYDAKEGELVNSDFLNGLPVDQALTMAIKEIESDGLGKKKVNYRLRDANFSRQRYWGEPFPIVYDKDNSLPYPVPFDDLPVELPEVQSYKPTGNGESPLASAEDWVNTPEGRRETNTMPGWAGSSWYFMRYMDPHNDVDFVDKEKELYWKNVDFYIGGAEHATGHLLYARFWHKFLFDRGLVTTKEPFKKLVNQGMITGVSQKIYLVTNFNDEATKLFVDECRDIIRRDLNLEEKDLPINFFISASIVEYRNLFNGCSLRYVPVEYVEYGGGYGSINNNNIKKVKENPTQNLIKAAFIGTQIYYGIDKPENNFMFHTVPEVEKMSKSKYNVINPDEVIEKYGCDSFRMYEMFLGPIEQSKPWDTKGIDGVSRFLKRFWALFYDRDGNWGVTDEKATPEELKILHKTIKKTEDDIERFNLNTCVSSYMIAVNELSSLNCH